jgi:histidyl-tRNA synthetase
MEFSLPKGTFDILPKEPSEGEAWRAAPRWAHVEETIRLLAAAYGFREIRTPIFERTELFTRTAGEASDIVNKEMYTFLDRGERSMTLRPEGTAPVMRAFIEHHLEQAPGLHKFFYIGPMFRYERPQAGRYRQHHQFGAEAIGVAAPEQDVEIIDLLMEVYRRLGLSQLTVVLNSVGDEENRAAFRHALVRYLTPHQSQLSPDSQNRLEKNPLRILDSKNEADQEIVRSAPKITDFLSPAAKDHFDAVKRLLMQLKIPFREQPLLVRGLDYYNRTVFEVVSTDLGAQNSLGGGGRYDGLLSSLGGPSLPSVGFGTGIERLLQVLSAQKAPFPASKGPLIFFVPMGEAAMSRAFELLTELRHRGIPADIDLSGKKIQHGLHLANSEGARYVVVIGETELSSGDAELKEMATRTGTKVALTSLVSTLEALRG